MSNSLLRVSEKNVENELSSSELMPSTWLPAGLMPCSRQYNSQQAFPIWTPANKLEIAKAYDKVKFSGINLEIAPFLSNYPAFAQSALWIIFLRNKFKSPTNSFFFLSVK
jgi:hypothetical protein